MIDEDLNELQSIMQRYHRKNSKKSLKKPKKRDGGLSNKNANIKRIGVDAITDVDPVLQSIYQDSYSNFGMTSYGKYNRRMDEVFDKASNDLENRQ